MTILEEVLRFGAEGKWVLVGALVIGAILRVFKEDIKSTPTVPAQWRPWMALALGVVEGVVQSIVGGTPWQKALFEGLAAAFTAIAGHDLLIESLRGGRELGGAATPMSGPVPAIKEGAT